MLYECYFLFVLLPLATITLHNEMWHYYKFKPQLMDCMKETITCNHYQ